MSDPKKPDAPVADATVVTPAADPRDQLGANISSSKRIELAKLAGCNPEEVVAYNDKYQDKIVVVVHNDVGPRKVEVPKRKGKA